MAASEIDWSEHPEELDGAALERAVELIDAHGARSQLCVLHEGRVVLDRTVNCKPDDLFLTFSTSKPFVALLVHLLAERGELSLDDPVCRHWPEFAASGKDAITIRQVLQHRAGVPVARSVTRDALAAPNWDGSIAALERARPKYPPGEVPAYHILSFGFILGEIVQRVTGRALRDVLARELLEPLALADTSLGLGPEQWSRRVPLRAVGRGALLRAGLFNLRRFRTAAIPAATISSTARDLARLYAALIGDGPQVIAPETIAQAAAPSTSDGEVDRFLKLPVRWSQGFQLGGPVAEGARPMGRSSSPRAFGHNGSYCCLAWADPTRSLAFAYLTDLLPSDHRDAPHQAEVSDAVLGAVRR